MGTRRPNPPSSSAASQGGRNAEQVFKDMGSFEGKSFEETKAILEKNGFEYRGPTPGGYQKFYGPGPKAERLEVHIRPGGQVVRVQHVRGGPPTRFNSTGRVTTDHQAGEFIGRSNK